MKGHLEKGDIRDFILGLHDDLPVEEIRAHLSECAECARIASQEAACEHALWEVRQHADLCPGCGRLARKNIEKDRCDHCGVAFRAGPFKINSVLVRTDQSRLYLAEDELGQVVALKELVFSQIPETSVIESFERESRLLRQLDHRQIPKFIESFQQGEGVSTRLYIAQEYVEGQSLLEKLENHRFEEQEVVELAKQILGILIYLQNLSPPVFHRDIKPANLIVKPDGTVVLVDFGAARDGGATQGGTAVGTFGYMPTEQLVGMVDSTTDLYALGASMIHLLSRRPPWEILDQKPVDRAVNVSGEFQSFLERLTEKNPQKRFQSAEKALASLDGRDQVRQKKQKKRFRRFAAAGITTIGAAFGYSALSSMDLLPDHSFFDFLSWMIFWGTSSEQGSGAFSLLQNTFLIFAVIGGVLFAARIVLQFFGGHGHSGEIDHGEIGHGDIDHGEIDHGNGDHGHIDTDLKLLTLHGITAFLVIFGLVGLTLSRQIGYGAILSILGALFAGVLMMWILAKIFSFATALQSSGTVDNSNAIGQVGTVYLTIPEDGIGKIHVTVQERLMEYEALSQSKNTIPTGEKIRVLAVKDEKIMIVEQIRTSQKGG